MQIYLDELAALVEQVGGFMGLDQSPRLWEVKAVCKSWSHYGKLEPFSPVMCAELTQYKDGCEWGFLVSEWFDPNNPEGGEKVWQDAGAFVCRVPGGSGLRYVLDIGGRPLHRPAAVGVVTNNQPG